METNVVFVEKAKVKNARLKIIEFLISNGALPESIKFSTQEIRFQFREEAVKEESQWCQELTEAFQGQIEFHSKYPAAYKF